jgi:purine nucleoside phosphorylase
MHSSIYKRQEIQNFRHKAVFYIGCEGVEWTHLAQHKDMCLAVVCMVMNTIIHAKQLLYELRDLWIINKQSEDN